VSDNFDKVPNQSIFKVFKEDSFVIVVDRDFFIVACSNEFSDFFSIHSNTIYVNLKDFFTINYDNYFANDNFFNKDSFKLKAISRYEKKEWVLRFNKVISFKGKEYFVVTGSSLTASKNGNNLSFDELNAIAFLLMGLAHEIKNPLAGIKVLVDMIECECEGRKDVATYLAKISKNVDRVNSMLDIFFSYARSDYAKKDIFPVSVIVEDVKLFQGYRIKRENVDFSVIVKNNDLQIIANKNNVLNIFFNLLSNALDSVILSNKILKKIEFRVFETEIPKSFDKSCISGFDVDEKKLIGVGFKVEDNGVGMDEFEKKHIFNPFFTTKDSGVGLGMSLVAKYVEESCGEIKVESAKGKGSCFTVILPGIKCFEERRK